MPLPHSFETAGLHVLSTEDAELLQIGALPTRLKVADASVAGAYFIVEQPVDPGVLVAPHVHTLEDQVSFVLEGSIGFKVGPDEFEAHAGTAVVRPRGVPHALWNATTSPARMLEITSPGGFEAYFRHFDTLVTGGQASRAAITALAAEYGLTFLKEWTPYLSEKYGVSASGSFFTDAE